MEKELLEDEERLRNRHREEREKILDQRSREERSAALHLQRSLRAFDHATEKAELRENTRLSRRAFQDAYPQFPPSRSGSKIRNSHCCGTAAVAVVHVSCRGKKPRRDTVPRPKYDIRDYHPREVDGWILYATAQQRARGETAFVDRGQRIDINDSKSEASILAALQLSAEKWGRFVARGDRGFKDTCARLAAEHGFDLRNPGTSNFN